MKPLLSIQGTRGAASRFRLPIATIVRLVLASSMHVARTCRGRRSPQSAVTISIGEARHNLVIETLVFALVTSAVPAIFDCGRALLDFMHAIGAM